MKTLSEISVINDKGKIYVEFPCGMLEMEVKEAEELMMILPIAIQRAKLQIDDIKSFHNWIDKQ